MTGNSHLRTPTLMLLAVMASLAWAPTAWAQTDQIVVTQGPPLTGTIVDSSPNGLTINVSGTERQVPVVEISKVMFGDEPSELRRGRDAAAGREYATALEELAKVDAAALRRDLVKAELEYVKAYAESQLALAGTGDKAAAVRNLLTFMSANRNSFHAYEAAELLGDLAVSLESYDNAIKYYGFLGRAPWPKYQLRAAILEGRVLYAQGRLDEALAKFDTAASANADSPETNRQKLVATAGKAMCLAALGKSEEGLKLAQPLVEKNDPQDQELAEMFARAYNAIGVCHLKANQPKEALFAFLHTDLLFPQIADAHAEALFYLTKLWADANKADRSVRARTLLTTEYGGSVWAKRLQ